MARSNRRFLSSWKADKASSWVDEFDVLQKIIRKRIGQCADELFPGIRVHISLIVGLEEGVRLGGGG